MRLLVLLWFLLLASAQARPRFVLLPLDNRPCNLLFVRQIGRIAQSEVVTPPVHLLGNYLEPGQPEALAEWLKHQLRPGDQLLLSSDMLCFGGLVASRQAATSLEQARQRLKLLEELRPYHVEVLATLPRLSLRTSDEQAPFERALHDWATREDSPAPADVPPQWVREYIGVRARNLEVLKELIRATLDGRIERLVIGQDDSHRSGLHKREQLRLLELRDSLGLEKRVMLLSGADELSMNMLAGRLSDLYDVHPEIALEYSEAGSERRIPPLESHPLATTVEQHLLLGGAHPGDPGDPSLLRLFIQVPAARPYRLPEASEAPRSYALVERVREWMDQGRAAALADLAYINRMDPHLARAVIDRLDLVELEGFAAWNTPANALGTVVAQVVVREIAHRQAEHWKPAEIRESARTHLAFLLARLIDDYGYQTMVRTELIPETHGLPLQPDPLLSPYIRLGAKVRQRLLGWAEELYRGHFLGRVVRLPGGGKCRLGPMKLEAILPWPRLFEVEVRLDLVLEDC
jgi:hypothetical protein